MSDTKTECPTPLRVIGQREWSNPWNREAYVNCGDMMLWLQRQTVMIEANNGDKGVVKGLNYVYDEMRKAQLSVQKST